MLNQRVKVSSGTYLAPPIVNVVQNDTGRVLVCEPFDYTITGAETATLICRRPDDTIFTYTGTVNAADNDVSIPLAAEGGALTQVGDVDAELILTASGSTMTTFKITLRVQEDISGEATPEEKTFVAQLVSEVDASFAEYQAALNDVEGQLDDLVPKTTKVNGKALSSDITLAPSDLGAVPETRTVNGHALDENVELDASDVGAVPEERTVNNYPLDDDVNVMAVDVPFTPNGSLTSDNVQDAIDEVRDMVEVGHETVLYTGSVTAIDAGTYPLDDNVANYQYLDIWIGYNGRYSIQRIPTREAITFSFRIPNISNSTSTFLYVAEIDLEFSGSVMTVTNVGSWQQGNGSTYSPTRSQSAAIYIEKILGIKYDALSSSGGGVPIVIDNQLSPNSTNPVQNKVVYEAVLGGGGFSNAAKIALLNCFANVAWINENGQQYYDALYDALYPETPPAQLVSITAVFDQTGVTIYDTDSLDDLKPYLTVTAEYDDSTTEEVTNYVLSGTLTAGTSTITVSYGGMTDTFDVVVTHNDLLYVLPSAFESDGTNYIDTGVAFELNKKYSLAITFSISQFTQNATTIGAVASFIYGDTHGETSGYTAMSEEQINGGTQAGRYVWGSSFGFEASKNFVNVNQTVKFLFTFDVGASTYIRNWYIKNVTAGTSNSGTASNPVTAIKGHNMFLGKQETAAGKAGFIGTISDFRIYDRLLTSDEINAYMG